MRQRFVGDGAFAASQRKDFLGVGSARETAAELAAMVDALRHDNEFDLSALRGLFAVANS